MYNARARKVPIITIRLQLMKLYKYILKNGPNNRLIKKSPLICHQAPTNTNKT